MKIAVIGASPAGIELATHFTNMGAFVRVFEQGTVGGNLHFEIPHMPMGKNWAALSTELGRKQISFQPDLKSVPTVQEYLENYFLPLTRHFSQEQNLLHAKVERVHKRFLSLDEEVKNRSRLADLFRVVYSLEPVVVNDDNREAFQTLEEKLGPAMMESLKDSMEYYEDFDLVFDCSGRMLPMPMGPSASFAIGEKRLLGHPEIIYGRKALQNEKSKLREVHELALIGDDKEAAYTLIELEDWIKQSGHFLTLICSSENAFAQLNPELMKLSQKVLAISETIYAREKDEFLAKMEDWKNLDDFVRVKMPRPLEPRKKISIYESCNVTSVDKLIDQSKIFLSLENPDFRKQVLKEDIQTFGFDLVLVMNGRKKDLSLFEGLRANEAGFYHLDDVAQINEFEKNVLSYFSRA